MPAEVKPKPVMFRKIPERGPDGQLTRWYVELNRIVAAYHPGLVEFKLALMWKRGWQPDKDGLLILGQAVKASEDARQLHGVHGYIRLNEEWFHEPTTPDEHKIAVLDHECCHFAAELDRNGDTRKDEDGSPCIRMVKHDLEEFMVIVDRYGLYTDRLRRMAGTMWNARERDRRINPNAVTNTTPPLPPQEEGIEFEELGN